MRFIRLKEVMHCTALGKTTIYELMKQDKFPKQVSIGGRAVAWIESEVDDWIMKKIEERDK